VWQKNYWPELACLADLLWIFQQILAEKRLQDKAIVDNAGAIRLPQLCRCVSSRKLRMRSIPGKSPRLESEGAMTMHAPDRALNKMDNKKEGETSPSLNRLQISGTQASAEKHIAAPRPVHQDGRIYQFTATCTFPCVKGSDEIIIFFSMHAASTLGTIHDVYPRI
jgi:hypothetical protein